jgi:hypothetical protein
MWPRQRGEASLRKEMRARPVVDFRARVDVKADMLGIMLTARGPLDIVVRGDAFEVSHPFPPARFLFAQEYAYRAGDTTIEVVPGLWHDWIEVQGQPGEPAAWIWIGRRNLNRQIWDALVDAGAHPLGSSPPS